VGIAGFIAAVDQAGSAEFRSEQLEQILAERLRSA
jgi:hypothetical protein